MLCRRESFKASSHLIGDLDIYNMSCDKFSFIMSHINIIYNEDNHLFKLRADTGSLSCFILQGRDQEIGESQRLQSMVKAIDH